MKDQNKTALRVLEEVKNELQHLNQLTIKLLEVSTATAETLGKIGAALAAGLQQPATTQNGGGDQLVEFDVDTLVFDLNDGKPVFKMRGPLYPQYGVRVWPEVLPRLGIDEATLKPGMIDFSARVTAVMGDIYPKKIIGLADPDQAHNPPPPPAADSQAPQEPEANKDQAEEHLTDDEYPF